MRANAVVLSIAVLCGIALAEMPAVDRWVSDACLPQVTTMLGRAGTGSRELVAAAKLEPADSPDETLHYDGPNDDGLGLTAGGTFMGAARFTPTAACSVKAVLFFHYDPSSDQFVLIYGQGTDTTPGAVIDSARYNGADTTWLYVPLAQPIYVAAGTDFWAAARITHTSGVYPLGIDAGPMVQNRGGFVELGGVWYQLNALGFNVNCNIRAVVVPAQGVEHDVGVLTVLAPTGNVQSGAITPRATIKNFGATPESNIPVTCWIDSSGTHVYDHTITFPGPLAPNGTADVAFSPDWLTGPAGNRYTVRIFTSLVGDANPVNDTARATCTVVSFNLTWTDVTQGVAPARYWCPGTGAVRDTIWFCGGRTQTAASIRLITGYDAVNDVWVTSGLPTLPTPRRAGGGGVIGNRIYVAGGRDSSSVTLATCQFFDVDTKTCSSRANMPSARWAVAGAVAAGKLYIIGSESRDGITYEYDPVTNTWATKAMLPVGRGWSAAAGAGGMVYVFGGAGTSAALNDCWMLDPVANTWTQKANMPGTREYHKAVTYNDTLIFVIGGDADGATPADGIVYKYNTNSNTWTTETPLNHPRGWEMCSQAGEYLYATYGSDCTTPTYLLFNERGTVPGGGPGAVVERINPNQIHWLRGVTPNPFANAVRIDYYLARNARVDLGIYDAAGNLVRTLVSGKVTAGEQSVTWNRKADDGRRVANGTYFYKLVVDGAAEVGKAIVVK